MPKPGTHRKHETAKQFAERVSKELLEEAERMELKSQMARDAARKMSTRNGRK